MTSNYDRNLMVTAAVASAILGLLEYQRIAGPARTREDFDKLKYVILNVTDSLKDVGSVSHCRPSQRDTTEYTLLMSNIIQWLISIIESRTDTYYLSQRGQDFSLGANFATCLEEIHKSIVDFESNQNW